MELCTLLWLLRRNAFFLTYSGIGRAASWICGFVSSRTAHSFLLMVATIVLFYLIYQSKEYKKEAWYRHP